MTTYSTEAQRTLDAAPKGPTYTPAWAIEKTLAIREEEREDTKSYEARSAKRKLHMDLLGSYLLSVLNERQEEQIKTSAGTAYKSPQMRVTMKDRQAVIETIVNAIQALDATCDSMDEFLLKAFPLFEVFTNHVNKDWVKQQLDAKINPDGIEIHRFTTVNVRKA